MTDSFLLLAATCIVGILVVLAHGPKHTVQSVAREIEQLEPWDGNSSLDDHRDELDWRENQRKHDGCHD